MRNRLYLHFEKLKPHLLLVLLLVIAVCAVYAQMLNHQFLSNWDDNRYVLENADIQGFGWERIKAVFSTYYVGNYAPVQMLSYMLDYAVWGLWPGGYLFGNILLHTANGLLLYRLFFRLMGGRAAAFFGAAVFLLHPVQVESVAWISQRKNLLAMFFFLLAWECYRSYRDSSGRRCRFWYGASLLALLLALLAKSVAVIFPLVILLFDCCYPAAERRFRLLDKLPYFLVAAAVAMVAVLSQTPDYQVWGAGGGRAGYHGGSALTTFLSMLPVLCSYLRLVFWPSGLSVFYSTPLHRYPDQYVIMAILLLAGIFWLIGRLYRHDRRAAFWPLLFFIGLLPVSQVVPLVTMMNDRYLYFPLLGVAGLTVWTVKASAVTLGQRPAFSPLLAVPLLLLAFLSFQRIPVWQDAITLWKDTVRKVPDNSQAWEALGEASHYTARPNWSDAVSAYRRAIELNPDSDMSRYNLGVAYTELNDYTAADAVLGELLRRSPRNVMGWTAYGDLALRRYEYGKAEQRYLTALALQPEAVQVQRKLGNLMVVIGRTDRARSVYLRIESIQGGNDPLTAYELARVEAVAGDTGEAVGWLEKALKRGYNDYVGILNDEELVPVMADGRFSELMQRYFPRQ